MDEHDSPEPRLRGAPPQPAGAPVVAGRYRVERLIARGGMAAVFLAEHIALRRHVALKILHPPPDTEESGNFQRRFKLEAETLAGLTHPNIVTLYDYGEAEDGRYFLAMEYIDGPRFTDLLSGGALAPDRTITLIMQVCAALRYAHKRGVIHRDLKPSNLLLQTDGDGNESMKVVDFGLVKVTEVDQMLTREGLVLGSPHCMAPEQVKGVEIDHRADIYAIGVLLFRSLTGSYPFHGATATATMVAHLNEPVPPFATVAPDLKVPGRLEEVVRRCLAKKPADRYPDVKALMDDLSACIGAAPEPDTTSLQLEENTRPRAGQGRRNTLAVALVLLLLLVMVGGAALWVNGRPSPEPLPPPPPVNGAAGGTTVPGPVPPTPGDPTGASVGTGTPGTPPGKESPGPEDAPSAPPIGTQPPVTGTHPQPPVGVHGTGTPVKPTTSKQPPTTKPEKEKVPSSDKTEDHPPGYMPLPDDL